MVPCLSRPVRGCARGGAGRSTWRDYSFRRPRDAPAVARGSGGRIGLGLAVSGAEHGHLAASLRTVGRERTELVASQPARAGKPVAFGGLVPGRYVLGILETPRDLRFRVGFEVASPPASG